MWNVVSMSLAMAIPLSWPTWILCWTWCSAMCVLASKFVVIDVARTSTSISPELLHPLTSLAYTHVPFFKEVSLQISQDKQRQQDLPTSYCHTGFLKVISLAFYQIANAHCSKPHAALLRGVLDDPCRRKFGCNGWSHHNMHMLDLTMIKETTEALYIVEDVHVLHSRIIIIWSHIMSNSQRSPPRHKIFLRKWQIL